MNRKTGKLFGIGVGPGDPELISVKAVRILKQVDIIFAASSSKNSHSLALDIAKEHIPETTKIVMLSFPMTKDRKKTEKAWHENAKIIIDHVTDAKQTAFITVGDSTTYSTFGYITKVIQNIAPDLPIETIPGITSYQAAAARLNIPLVKSEESLLITSGVGGGNILRNISPLPENIVFLKAYKNASDIANALEEKGMIENSVGMSRCGMEDEEIIEDVGKFKTRKPGYWTVIIAKKSKP